VRAAGGQAVACVYYFDERQGKPGRLVSRDEAEDVAARIVTLADGLTAPAPTVATAALPAAVQARSGKGEAYPFPSRASHSN
jgi:hypothetical protein